MAKEPADRPATAAEVADQLEEMARSRNLRWTPQPLDPAPSPEDVARAAEKTQLITMPGPK